MLTELKKEKSHKELFMTKRNKKELKITSKMTSELIADIISDKLLKKIKNNIC